MKIFDEEKHWRTKVNFVDENNVFVGYDMDASCCEWYGWYITENEEDVVSRENEHLHDTVGSHNLDSYTFDRNYYRSGGDGDEMGWVVFKLVGYGADKYLFIFNCHNGYYSHGFEFGLKDGEIFREGSI